MLVETNVRRVASPPLARVIVIAGDQLGTAPERAAPQSYEAGAKNWGIWNPPKPLLSKWTLSMGVFSKLICLIRIRLTEATVKVIAILVAAFRYLRVTPLALINLILALNKVLTRRYCLRCLKV